MGDVYVRAVAGEELRRGMPVRFVPAHGFSIREGFYKEHRDRRGRTWRKRLRGDVVVRCEIPDIGPQCIPATRIAYLEDF